jgi:hypothetical protein
MSRSDGRKRFAPGRLAAVVSVAVILLAGVPGTLWLLGVDQRREVIQQIASCTPSKDKTCPDKADVESARSANADEDSVDVAIAQAVLGVCAFVGLVFTILYARAAWVAAEKTLAATLEAERRQLRAYVLIKDARAKGLRGKGPLVVQVQVSNYGATPARKTRITYSANVYPRDFVPKIEARRFRDTSEDSVPTGGVRSFTIRLSEAAEKVALLRDPANRLFVWGVIEYEDIYGEPHATTFNYYATNSVRDEDGAFSMNPCPTGNSDT